MSSTRHIIIDNNSTTTISFNHSIFLWKEQESKKLQLLGIELRATVAIPLLFPLPLLSYSLILTSPLSLPLLSYSLILTSPLLCPYPLPLLLPLPRSLPCSLPLSLPLLTHVAVWEAGRDLPGRRIISLIMDCLLSRLEMLSSLITRANITRARN